MTKGIVLVAQNNNTYDYVEQATALAMSVNKFNDIPVSIITNDVISNSSKKYFDKILPVEWGDMAEGKDWKIENRWKVFHQTPYKETIVMDTDMLILKNIDNLWNFYSNYDLFFTTNPVTYRNETVTSAYYRKMFVDNNLPNIYSALYYFKKNEFTHNFFAYLELVVKNFDEFQKDLCPTTQQEHLSLDVAIAMTVKLMNIEDQVTNKKSNVSRFVHMKSFVQNWKKSRNAWQNIVPTYLTKDLELYIGNYKQNNIFHYTEKDFLSNHKILEKLGNNYV